MSDETTGVVLPVALPADEPTRIEREGFRDGVLGQTWREYGKILEAKAEARRVEDECEAQKRRELQRAEMRLAREGEERLRDESERIEREYQMVASDRDRKPSSYSRPWGLIFVGLAVLLVFADFPLTRQIVSAMSIGSDSVWTIEQILVAAGIVVISLFFKLLADPFTQPQYLMSRWTRVIMRTLSVLIAIVVLVGVVGTLFLLGMFRGGAIASEAGGDTVVEETFTATSSDTAAPPSTTTDPAAGSVDTRLRTLERFRDFTFVVLGLTLPIIGGIFASVGMARIHNQSRLRNLAEERAELRTTHDAAARQARMAEAAVESVGHDLAAIRARVALAGGEMHSYLHAYETGFCSPEAARGRVGLASRLRETVEKWVAIIDQSQNLVRTEVVAEDGTRPAQSEPSELQVAEVGKHES